ncbi:MULTISPECIES: response regulator [Mesorhizobium]|uniref:response regulator n=1 Tax=Mesorhizobium TaxID=68287 RepID=UPI000FCB4A08|nr:MULTISPECIES: response regulator [Mesorhizobium]MDX8435559.1 response regulator [Mesorhizobium abyssinicae]RUW71542.1 response regulator [Mesorhizobium sp. M4B.F.Ca.ET.049.02.1.2]RVD29759.1 response regulator [Mesorhizobium sp. M4B.F.Ca.ET.017.02.2.1]TGV25663.1 response regulator [Mesorhizobium sp. M4B.F.Ca.ET.143.01.1.1]
MTGQAKRVLILEDEFLVAMLLEDLLLEMGHQVVGSLAQVGEAMTFADQADIDLAILDINLAGTKSFPVAEILRRRGIPFVFATGYGSDGLTGDFENELTLQKPYDPDELRRTIEQASARAGLRQHIEP